MATEKIADLDTITKLPCDHPEHLHAKYCVFKPGVYRHTCPKCGHSYTFVSPDPARMW